MMEQRHTFSSPAFGSEYEKIRYVKIPEHPALHIIGCMLSHATIKKLGEYEIRDFEFHAKMLYKLEKMNTLNDLQNFTNKEYYAIEYLIENDRLYFECNKDDANTISQIKFWFKTVNELRKK
jgi:hypothetical protein